MENEKVSVCLFSDIVRLRILERRHYCELALMAQDFEVENWQKCDIDELENMVQERLGEMEDLLQEEEDDSLDFSMLDDFNSFDVNEEEEQSEEESNLEEMEDFSDEEKVVTSTDLYEEFDDDADVFQALANFYLNAPLKQVETELAIMVCDFYEHHKPRELMPFPDDTYTCVVDGVYFDFELLPGYERILTLIDQASNVEELRQLFQSSEQNQILFIYFLTNCLYNTSSLLERDDTDFAIRCQLRFQMNRSLLFNGFSEEIYKKYHPFYDVEKPFYDYYKGDYYEVEAVHSIGELYELWQSLNEDGNDTIPFPQTIINLDSQIELMKVNHPKEYLELWKQLMIAYYRTISLYRQADVNVSEIDLVLLHMFESLPGDKLFSFVFSSAPAKQQILRMIISDYQNPLKEKFPTMTENHEKEQQFCKKIQSVKGKQI